MACFGVQLTPGPLNSCSKQLLACNNGCMRSRGHCAYRLTHGGMHHAWLQSYEGTHGASKSAAIRRRLPSGLSWTAQCLEPVAPRRTLRLPLSLPACTLLLGVRGTAAAGTLLCRLASPWRCTLLLPRAVAAQPSIPEGSAHTPQTVLLRSLTTPAVPPVRHVVVPALRLVHAAPASLGPRLSACRPVVTAAPTLASQGLLAGRRGVRLGEGQGQEVCWLTLPIACSAST